MANHFLSSKDVNWIFLCTLIIPTKSKEETKEFFELLNSFSCKLEKKCSRNDGGVEVMGVSDDGEDYDEV